MNCVIENFVDTVHQPSAYACRNVGSQHMCLLLLAVYVFF